MGKYFADVHASYKSQFENLPHGLTDTDEILACRAKSRRMKIFWSWQTRCAGSCASGRQLTL